MRGPHSVARAGADAHICLCCRAQLLGPLGARDALGVGPAQQLTDQPEPGGDLRVPEGSGEEPRCQQQEVGEK